MQDIETTLRERLEELPAEQQEELVRFVKAKLLESYRNGMEAAKTGKTQNSERTADRRSSRR